MSVKGIKTVSSPRSVRETTDELQSVIQSNGAVIYARIDQQLEVGKVGIGIAALEFLLFGNPAAGGKLIRDQPIVALDLPLKVIVWEDKDRKVWVSYNESEYLVDRYALNPETGAPLNLDKLVNNSINKFQ